MRQWLMPADRRAGSGAPSRSLELCEQALAVHEYIDSITPNPLYEELKKPKADAPAAVRHRSIDVKMSISKAPKPPDVAKSLGAQPDLPIDHVCKLVVEGA